MRRYLLGQLAAADEAQVELRLLTDASYGEELEIMVDELLDQYVTDELPPPEREQVEQHFLKSQQRLDKLECALALKRHKLDLLASKVRAGKPLAFFRTRRPLTFYLPIAASVIIVLGLSAVIWRVFIYQRDLNNGLIALQTAYRQQRPVEARISGFNYAPPVEQRGGATKVDYIQRDRAAALLLNAVVEHPNAASQHALGQYYLSEHQFDKAVAQFEAALKDEPNNAQLHSDLGAALLEAGKVNQTNTGSGKSLEEFAQSLEHLDKALQLNGSLLEALFNRALCHQYMMLPQQAADDWRTYLEKDPNSMWADEARRNLQILEEQKNKTSQNREQLFNEFIRAYQEGNEDRAWVAIEDSSCRIGNYVSDRLIDEYLASAARGQPDEALNNLRMLSTVGRWKAQKTGDLYISDLVHRYESASSMQLVELAHARNLVKTGQEQVTEQKFATALESYIEAKDLFDQARDKPEAKLAEYWQAICYQQLNNKEQSASLLSAVALTCQRDNYKWLTVRSLNGLAYYQAILTDYSKSIGYSSQSLKIAEQAQDIYGLFSALSQLIEGYRYLGNYQQSLIYICKALALANLGLQEKKQIWLKYDEISWSLNSLGFYAAAADYQKAALQIALELGELSKICVSYTRLGAIYGHLQNYDAALKNVQHALGLARSHSSERINQQMIAYSSLQIGELYRQAGELNKALASYDECLALYDSLKFPAFIYEAHKGKLLSYIAGSNASAANQELDVVLDLYERYRSEIREENDRNSFFDVEQDVYDIAIAFQYSEMNDPRKAFEYSELSRARSLLAFIRRSAGSTAQNQDSNVILPNAISTPFDLAEIQSRMPDNVQILQYAATQDKIFFWIISKTSFQTTEETLGLEKLNKLVQNYLQLISSPNTNEAETLSAATELYDVLIRPTEPFLERNKQLCIVPDKILNFVPYYSLVSSATRKYLIEHRLIILAPSANVFLVSSEAARTKSNLAAERLLSVGNPYFDHEAFPALSDLPAAGREAEKITAYYPAHQLLIGKQAEERAVTNGMEQAEVVHLALHSIVDELSPAHTELLLTRDSSVVAGDKSSDGILEAQELHALKLSRTRLVILSACQTGLGRAYRGEGASSMARQFIALGVPLVIASLWTVDSDAAAELMVNFHRHRKLDRLSTANALRQAQLAMLHGSETRYQQPYYWAPFVLIGGYAEF